MAKYARGLICTPVSSEIAVKAGLQPMTEHNSDGYQTAFTTSIDQEFNDRYGAFERFNTTRALIDENVSLKHLTVGHVFPLIAKDGGVREKTGIQKRQWTCKTGRCQPAGVICEIMNDDGTMARLDDLMIYKEKHNLKIITIEMLKIY